MRVNYHLHGKRRAPIYAIWSGIIGRCLNPKNKAFPNYGGRGIAVCDEWKTFPGFYADMGDPPPGGSIDRIDNNGAYSPQNCRWATRSEQSRNRRDRKFYTVGGETMLLSDWAARTGFRIGTLHYRLKLGWSIEAAITTPLVTDRKGKPRGHKFHDGAEDGAVAKNAAPRAA
jgi:hypothetical protein